MSLMDMFRNIASNNASTDPNATGNARLDQTKTVANPTADPATQQKLMKVEEPPIDPLTALSDIWNLPKEAADTLPKSVGEFSFNFKPEDVATNARKIDFTKGMPQDILDAVTKGGPEAAAALFKAMNYVGQQSFLNASLASARITEAGVRSAGVQMENNLPNTIKREATSTMLREDNPLFASPAVQPIVAMLEAQAAAKYPTATPQQITEHVRKYFTTVIAEGSKHLGVQAPTNPGTVASAQAGDFSGWEI